MKKLVLGCLFFGVAANACPNLTGAFLCGDKAQNQAQYLLSVTQNEANGVTSYTATTDQGESVVVADGVARSSTEQDSGGIYFQQDTFSCTETALVDTFIENYSDLKGNIQDEISGVQNITVNEKGDLAFSTDYVSHNGDRSHQDSICVRQ